jgi:formate hydrogenlyase subunit 6/NADH:ubiquinone oxidoreductase subunit I
MRLGWIIEGLRTGIVTTKYPARPDTSLADLHIRPVLFAERCQATAGCDACIQACLPDALTLERSIYPSTTQGSSTAPGTDTLALTLDLGRCIGCGLCATSCPNEAIAMTSDFELATHTRDALCQTAPVGSHSPSMSIRKE